MKYNNFLEKNNSRFLLNVLAPILAFFVLFVLVQVTTKLKFVLVQVTTKLKFVLVQVTTKLKFLLVQVTTKLKFVLVQVTAKLKLTRYQFTTEYFNLLKAVLILIQILERLWKKLDPNPGHEKSFRFNDLLNKKKFRIDFTLFFAYFYAKT